LSLHIINNHQRFIINSDIKIRRAIKILNELTPKVIFIQINNFLAGSLTDGDVRRGLINDFSLDDPVSEIMNKNPYFVDEKINDEKIKILMLKDDINLIPKIDINGRIEFIYNLSNSNQKNNLSNTMIIMAGGIGSRLLPLTEQIPKALVRVGNHPMIEHIILNAKKNGIFNFIISINHLGEKIKSYLGDGSKFNVKIQYLEEKEFLGTAGSLSLLNTKKVLFPIIVTNCDVISELDLYDLLDFHKNNKNEATMVIKKHEIHNPFGVVKLNGNNIIGFEEKPVYKNFINTGLYVLEKKITTLLSNNQIIDMPSLLDKALSHNMSIGAFHVHESWFDIGSAESLKEAHDYLIRNEKI